MRSGVTKAFLIFSAAAGLTYAQQPYPPLANPQQPYPAQDQNPRGLIDRTQQDLRQAADFERQHGHKKEVERYENAQRHLSDFDRAFTKGHFDKGKLGAAIDDVKNVVEHNTLDPQERDALSGDLQQLRVMKDHRY